MAKHEHDPALDVFDEACLVLSQDGEDVGYLATVLSTFRTPFRPLTNQDWFWGLVIWNDGTREAPFEDYPPWHDVTDLLRGEFRWAGSWGGDPARFGTYDVRWLPDGERQRKWAELGITPKDF